MKDTIIAGTGNSQYLKSSIPADATWEDVLDMLRNGTFPIDLNGINLAGFTQLGTVLNKQTLLPDAVATAVGLDPSDDPVPADALAALKNLIPTDNNQLANGSHYITALQAPVQSVAGKTGAVTLDAGDMGYYTSGDYAAGTVGAELSELDVAVNGEVVNVTGSTPTITGVANRRYMCGTVTTLSVTPPQSGTIEVLFTSGATATVLTLPNTVKFPGSFDPTSLEAYTIYDICIMDGIYGGVIAWEN